MLIEFRIQLDNKGGVTFVPAQQSADQKNSTTPPEVVLTESFSGAENTKTKTDKPGSGPFGDGGTGMPSSGPGAVIVLGPIVLCGPCDGRSGPGGSGPFGDGGTGKPGDNEN